MIIVRNMLVICMLVVLSWSAASGQQDLPADCDLCPGLPWGPEETTVSIAISPTCNASITYKKRLCQGVSEVQVVRVNLLPGCPTADHAGTYHKAIAMVTFNNGFGLPLPATAPGVNVVNWRIIRQSCTQPGTVTGTIVGCQEYCCVSDINVRRMGDCDTWFFAGEVVRNEYVNCQSENPLTEGCAYSCLGELVKKKGTSATPQ
jgi:hypothetical protein